MFRRLESSLPKDFEFPDDLEGIGCEDPIWGNLLKDADYTSATSLTRKIRSA